MVKRKIEIGANGQTLDSEAVTLGQRIEERRAALGISQAELARRVGIRQSTLNSLINGDSRSSRSIIDLARELRTTPEFLLGKSDDPAGFAPSPADLPAQDRQLVDIFGSFKSSERSFLIEMLQALAENRTKPIEHVPETKQMVWPSEHAIAAMFEAQLRVYGSLEGAALARALAKRLPKGIARLQEVPLSEEPAALPADAVDDQPPASDRSEPRQARRR
ncbi:helix-turn-helix domain-containing protein [Sphingomonas abaci]|uniref:Transcriptional regulator with XRE-family HTH domain n=1 Tax=Sphingomonas abaci TaxID=237611 RepID=A0A7W7EZI0_9SPHN|nr:helix-turn-helix domain-containing protein [Sphingomonas abaci]MBB4619129.1 transcriptional regulator with XRE-family HTH domain [Sphingomonas abaci]